MRIVFLRPLRAAGPVLLTALLTLLLLQALLPTATALAMGELVGRVRGVPGEELWQAVLWPLLAFTGLLLGTHLLECLTEPLDFLARARADGDHRRRLLLRAAGTPTLEVLERPGTRQLLRTAAADPENWTERKPSDGAVAQLRLLCAAVGFGASAVVLAGYAWWAVPVLVVPAVALRVHFGRSISAFVRRWLAGTGAWDQMMVWASALASGGGWQGRTRLRSRRMDGGPHAPPSAGDVRTGVAGAHSASVALPRPWCGRPGGAAVRVRPGGLLGGRMGRARSRRRRRHSARAGRCSRSPSTAIPAMSWEPEPVWRPPPNWNVCCP